MEAFVLNKIFVQLLLRSLSFLSRIKMSVSSHGHSLDSHQGVHVLVQFVSVDTDATGNRVVA